MSMSPGYTTASVRLHHQKQKRLPPYLTKHPAVLNTLKTIRWLLPISAGVLWAGAWGFSPEYFDYGVLRSKTGGGGGGGTGRVRFGGLGFCVGDECTISPWYEIPPGYLPGELTAYLPCLLTLFNLLGGLILLLWCFCRYATRPFAYFRTWRKNRPILKSAKARGNRTTLHPSSTDLFQTKPFEPYIFFDAATPGIHHSLEAFTVISMGLTISFFVSYDGETGGGVQMVAAGWGCFLAWRGLECLWETWEESVSYLEKSKNGKGGVRREEFSEPRFPGGAGHGVV